MNRAKLIQLTIDVKRAKNYLEIGVFKGETFLQIHARRKMAVDPELKIKPKSKIKSIRKNWSNFFSRYFPITSDEFFATRADLLRQHPLDVVFVDGLHTHAQTLMDVQNSLKYLKDDGVIIMHDCNPQSEAAAYPAKSYEHAKSLNLLGWTDEWSGDVWKCVAFLRATADDLHVFVLDCDHGLGVITRGKPESRLGISPVELDGLTYHDLKKSRQEFLNLKGVEYISKYLERLQAVGR